MPLSRPHRDDDDIHTIAPDVGDPWKSLSHLRGITSVAVPNDSNTSSNPDDSVAIQQSKKISDSVSSVVPLSQE